MILECIVTQTKRLLFGKNDTSSRKQVNFIKFSGNMYNSGRSWSITSDEPISVRTCKPRHEKKSNEFKSWTYAKCKIM